MAKKNKKQRVCGVTVWVPVKKDHDRPRCGRPAVFHSKKEYSRKGVKAELARACR